MWFSLDEESPFIKKLSAEGKIAVYENGFITIKKRRMEDQDRTCHSCAFNTGGKAKFKCSGSNPSQLCLGFKTKILVCPYNPSAAQTPDE
jgi:cyanophycin synthetase